MYFTADYAPPCAAFLQAFTAFCNEANKDPLKKKFEVVVVNCDQTEESYKSALAKMHPSWYNVPFESTKVMEQLEDIAKASVIPRVSIMKPSATLNEPLLKDIKPIILKQQAVDLNVKELMDKLSQF